LYEERPFISGEKKSQINMCIADCQYGGEMSTIGLSLTAPSLM